MILTNSMKKVPAASGELLSQQHPPTHNSVQHIYEEWDIPIIVHS